MRERVVVRNTFRFWEGGGVTLGTCTGNIFGLMDVGAWWITVPSHCIHIIMVVIVIVSIVIIIIIIGLATMLIEKSSLLYQICRARCPK